LDDWTTSLLTNPEVIAVDQHSTNNRPVITGDNVVAWTAQPEASKDYYIVIFNISDTAQTVRYNWKDLGLDAKSYKLRDLWEHKDSLATTSLNVTLPPHASILYRASLPGRKKL
jgi:hypothetical protein